jgi:hypothetical protein
MARRNYQRKKGKRRLKKMFLLSTEGTVTEPQYFSGFNSDTTVLHVRVIRNRGSLAGAQIKYFVYARGQLVALMGFGASAWKIAPRN